MLPLTNWEVDIERVAEFEGGEWDAEAVVDQLVDRVGSATGDWVRDAVQVGYCVP